MSLPKMTFVILYADKTIIKLQPEFWKCWEVFFYLNKIKSKRLSNHMCQYFFTIENREHNTFLNREILHFYRLNELISNLMPATGL